MTEKKNEIITDYIYRLLAFEKRLREYCHKNGCDNVYEYPSKCKCKPSVDFTTGLAWSLADEIDRLDINYDSNSIFSELYIIYSIIHTAYETLNICEQYKEYILYKILIEMLKAEHDFRNAIEEENKEIDKKIEGIVKELRKYCHRDGCEMADNPFASPNYCKCYPKIDLNTSLAWIIANVANDLNYPMLDCVVDVVCKATRMHSDNERCVELNLILRELRDIL